MARRTGNIAILQADEHLLSLLRVRATAKGVDVLSFAQERGDWSGEDGALAAALKSFLGQHLEEEDAVSTILPRHNITTRIVVLPTQEMEEAAQMIRYSAQDYVPYAEDELTIDQSLLSKLPDGEARYLAVFAHKDIIDAHVALLQEASIDPENVFLSTTCLASAVAAASAQSESRRYALVNLASEGLEVIVMEGAKLEYSRGVATVQDWSTPDEAPAQETVLSVLGGGGPMEELTSEVRGSLAAYRRESEHGEGVEMLLLASDFADVSRPCEVLTQETGKDSRPATLDGGLATKGQEHLTGLPLAALGAALAVQGRAAYTINLVPESLTAERKLEGVKSTVLSVAALIVVLLLSLGGLYYQAMYQRQQLISELQEQADAIAPQARGVAAKQKQLQILHRTVSRSGSVLELLATICGIAPTPNINIARFTYHREEGIHLYGNALTVDDVALFADRIREQGKGALKLLSHARSLYTQDTFERGKTITTYQIAILPPEDEDDSPIITTTD